MALPIYMHGVTVALTAALALQTPTFRTSSRLVEVNVIVHDKNGAVANLTKDDFSLSDAGKPRAIGVFSVNTRAVSLNPVAMPPNTFSNRPQSTSGTSGNVTIVLLDALNTLHYGTTFADLGGPTHFEDHALGFGKIQLMKFVQHLNPDDRVAIYALGKNLRILCDFTSDPAHLEKVLKEYRDSTLTLAEVAEPPASHLGAQPEFDAISDSGRQKHAGLANADRTGLTVAALLAIANHAAGVPGRKNLVWLTASLPFSGSTVGRLLSRANIAIYPVDARGLVTSFNPFYRPGGLDTMQELADETGGRAFYNTNDLSGAIRKAVDDSAISYTLGFYVNGEALDGKFHELKIRVDRPGAEVRHPSGYYALRAESTAAQRQHSIQNALASPIESSAIHLLARLDWDKNSILVSASVDLHDLHLSEIDGRHKGSVELFFIQQDALGNTIDRSRERLNLDVSEEQYAAYSKSGVFYRKEIAPKAQTETIRILAGDPVAGTVGSLIVPIASVKRQL